MSFDLKSIMIYIFGIILLLMFMRLFKRPLIWVFRLMVCCVVGTIVIIGFNLIFVKTGMHLAINPFNGLTVGVLGVPGIVLLSFFGSVL